MKISFVFCSNWKISVIKSSIRPSNNWKFVGSGPLLRVWKFPVLHLALEYRPSLTGFPVFPSGPKGRREALFESYIFWLYSRDVRYRLSIHIRSLKSNFWMIRVYQNSPRPLPSLFLKYSLITYIVHFKGQYS